MSRSKPDRPAFILRSKRTSGQRLRVVLNADGRIRYIQKFEYETATFPPGHGWYSWRIVWSNAGRTTRGGSQIVAMLRECGVADPLAFAAGKHVILKRID